MDAKLLEKLRRITPEEQEILNGRHDINADIYVEAKGNVFDSKKLLDRTKLITVRPHTRFIAFPKHTQLCRSYIYV